MKRQKRKAQMKKEIGLILAVQISTGMAANSEQPGVSGRPNIIFFIADDMYLDMFNCLPEGEGKNLTPNIDRLAKEGTIMMNQYVVSPVCTPSRYNCLTGRYASRAVSSEFLKQTKAEEGQTVIQWNTFITASEKVLPHYLKELGYRTGMVGKSHVVEVKGLHEFPDYWADPHDPSVMAHVKENYAKTRQAILNIGFDFAESIYFDNPDWVGLGRLAVQNMEWIVDGGLRFIDQYGKQPFFLYFATTIPHAPEEPDRSWKADPLITANGYLDKAPNVLPARETLPERIKAAGLEGNNKELVLWLDDAVGALLAKLEEKGVLDNTVIFFFNDHGQKAKGSLYQGGALSPSIIWKKGGFKCGRICRVNVQNIDFSPTILEYAGAANMDDKFDGRSFKSVLDGEADKVHDSLYFELGYARAVIKGNYKYYAVRYPDYANNMSPDDRAKALRTYNDERRAHRMVINTEDPASPFSHFFVVPGGHHADHGSYGRVSGYFDPDQLYDLENDPDETRNLVKDPEYQNKLKELKAELRKYIDDLPGTFKF
jgi:arylsulfatase A-like enzyme